MSARALPGGKGLFNLRVDFTFNGVIGHGLISEGDCGQQVSVGQPMTTWRLTRETPNKHSYSKHVISSDFDSIFLSDHL